MYRRRDRCVERETGVWKEKQVCGKRKIRCGKDNCEEKGRYVVPGRFVVGETGVR